MPVYFALELIFDTLPILNAFFMANNKQIYDVAVVGGGPAGMMAAGRAAELGARVVLIEKNSSLGKKLLITGGGRCNITNAELDVKAMASKYGPKGKALIGSFTRFGVEEAMGFFTDRGLPLKVEAEKRAFPKTNKAEDVWRVMKDYLAGGGVEIKYSSPVKNVLCKEGSIAGIETSEEIVTAHNYIIATGGRSRPETGSTGEGFGWMRSLGHAVEESDPALVPIKLKDAWVKKLSGLSFAAARLSVFQDGQKQDTRIGKILLTHFGLSGPLALNMSKGISELFKYAPVQLELDIYPEIEVTDLDKRILEVFSRSLNKKVKNIFNEIVPARMVKTVFDLSKVDAEKDANAITKEERRRIAVTVKALPMNVAGFLGVEKAIVTSGGVSLKEVDFKTMQSKIVPNLYLAGDILNFDRLSGGFSLQICWTTGFLAGQNAAE
jgi:predicted Rossmann fold flavoprotein